MSIDRNKNQKLAAKIKQLRAKKGITQAELATLANLTTPAITLIETGQRWPRPSTFSVLAKALSVPVEDLIGDDPVINVKKVSHKKLGDLSPDEYKKLMREILGSSQEVEPANELKATLFDLINSLDDGTVSTLFDFASRLSRSTINKSKLANDSF